MNFHIITLFPESFDSYINASIVGRAIVDKKIKIKFYNPRDFMARPKDRVDKKPYGGGPGMVLEAMPIVKAIAKAKGAKKKVKIFFLSPGGADFTNEVAHNAVEKFTDVIIICGRYEGIDERVNKIFKTEKISIGNYVLTGGELPAMVMIDTMARQIPGVLGNFDSVEENRVSANAVYTRPEVLIYKGKKYKVPAVLLSGNHAKIDEWKLKNRG